MATFGTGSPYILTNIIQGYSSTVVSGATTSLSSSSDKHQFFTGGSAGQTVKLPNTTTLDTGVDYRITNVSTGTISVEIASTASLIATVAPNSFQTFLCVNDSTDAVSSWDITGLSSNFSLAGDVNGPFTSNNIDFVQDVPIRATTGTSSYISFGVSNPLINEGTVGIGALTAGSSSPLTSDFSVAIGSGAGRRSGNRCCSLGSGAAGTLEGDDHSAAGFLSAWPYDSTTPLTVGFGAYAVSTGPIQVREMDAAQCIGVGSYMIFQAGNSGTTGDNNVAVGHDILALGLRGTAFPGDRNVAIGHECMFETNNSVSSTAVGSSSHQGRFAVSDFRSGNADNSGNAIDSAGSRVATINAASGGLSLPQPTIVTNENPSFLNFDRPGIIEVVTSDGPQIVFYTSVNTTSFLGCSGGTGVMTTGNAITEMSLLILPQYLGYDIIWTFSNARNRVVSITDPTNFLTEQSDVPRTGENIQLAIPQSFNVALGHLALSGVQSQFNTAIGVQSLENCTVPEYRFGTVTCAGGTQIVSGTNTNWNPKWDVSNAYLSFGTGPSYTGFQVQSIDSPNQLTLQVSGPTVTNSIYALSLGGLNPGNTAIGPFSGQAITTGFGNTIIGNYTGGSAPISSTQPDYLIMNQSSNASPDFIVSPQVDVVFNSPRTVNSASYAQNFMDATLIFTGTNCVLTLLDAATFPGRTLIVKNVSANSVTSATSNVYPLGSNVLGTSILSAASGQWSMLQSDGLNWRIQMAN